VLILSILTAIGAESMTAAGLLTAELRRVNRLTTEDTEEEMN
jgi:hypothetical protein